MEANEKVLSVLQAAGSPLKSAEIAQQSGLEKKEVDKALKALKASGEVVSPKNCYYAPK
jgi:predicted transcriptional regulator